MITGFRYRGLKRLYQYGDRSEVPADNAEKLESILFVLDNAETVEALDLPGFRLHPLTGDLRGLGAITVRANWRVVLRFDDGQARDIDLVDCH